MNKPRWRISDWAGNVCFDGKVFKSFEDAEEFLSEFLGDDYEESRQEYEIAECAVRQDNYLDPLDPRKGLKRA